MKVKKAVIIGCGRIGTFFDTPDSDGVYSHAKAYTLHNGIELAGVFDIDSITAKRAGDLWNVSVLKSFKEIEELSPDMISICVPDLNHYEYIKMVATLSPDVVLAEKPLTEKVCLSKELFQLYSEKNILCNVNYSRRFDTYLQELRDNFLKGILGKVVAVNAVYGKGLLHNGSHLIDFFRWLFGEVVSIETFRALNDFSKEDPSVEFRISCEQADSIFVSIIDERIYTVFEINIFFEKKKVSLTRGGLSCTETLVKEDDIFKGYKDLIEEHPVETKLSHSMLNYIENSFDAAYCGKPLLSPLVSALETQKTCQNILEDYKK